MIYQDLKLETQFCKRIRYVFQDDFLIDIADKRQSTR